MCWSGSCGRSNSRFRRENTSNFHNQKPYDLPLSSRYSFTHGVHKLWVFSIYNPLSKGIPTKPRTEISIQVNNLKNLYIFTLCSFFFSFLFYICSNICINSNGIKMITRSIKRFFHQLVKVHYLEHRTRKFGFD